MKDLIPQERRNQVMNKLHELEERENVKVIYAAETGSRAWGFPSADSDWDVRFLYVHRLPWYVSVVNHRDVIEFMSDDRLLDVVGWDLRKAMTLLRRGTPSLNEWLHSPLPYCFDEEFLNKVFAVENDLFRPKGAIYHYYALSRNMAKEKLSGSDCCMKPFLYYLRGLLACRWIEEKLTPPPVLFHELMQATVKDDLVKQQIQHLVDLKRTSEEHDSMIIDPELMTYARSIEEYYSENINGLDIKNDQQFRDQELDSLILDMINKYSTRI